MTQTVQLVLDELVDGQNQAEIAVDEDLEAIDAIIQLSVKDRDLSTPPGSPAQGDRYYVKPTGTGAWAGHNSQIAVYLNGAWRFFVLREGWATWVDDEDVQLIWDGSAWVSMGGGGGGGGGAIIAQEDDATVSASMTTIDFTEPLAAIVTESPTGEANVNLAAYVLATGARPFSGAASVVKAAGDMFTAKVTADANDRVVIQNDRIEFGPGSAVVDTVLRRSAADQWTSDDELRMAADLRINSTKKLVVRDSDDSNQSSFVGGNQSADIAYTLPAAPPAANGYLLTATAAGVLSWDPSGSSAGSGIIAFGPGKRYALNAFSPAASQNTTTPQQAYFMYLGQTTFTCTPKFVEWYCGGVPASGTQTAEAGFFTTPNPPNKSAQTLTKVEATGTLDTMIGGSGTGLKRNTTGFTTAVAPGVHLWAGIRTDFSANEPVLRMIGDDWESGYVLILASSGALTASSTFAGTVPTASLSLDCPDLRGSLD